MAQQRTWLLPVLHVAIGDIVAAIARLHGDDVLSGSATRPTRRCRRNLRVIRRCSVRSSEAAGFRHDGTVENLVTRALEPV